MTGKKAAIVLLAAGIATFAVSLTASRLLTKGPEQAAADTDNAGQAAAPAVAAPVGVIDTPRLEEKHLYDLIREVRQKARECEARQETLAAEEKRLALARQLVEKETQDLEKLRLQLAANVTQLKQAQADLEKTRLAIQASETANLKRTAAIYDKMDPAAASKIIEGMCTNQQEADAVKILHYMSERSVAKVLAEMTDKTLAARLCEQMKLIKEQAPPPTP